MVFSLFRRDKDKPAPARRLPDAAQRRAGDARPVERQPADRSLELARKIDAIESEMELAAVPSLPSLPAGDGFVQTLTAVPLGDAGALTAATVHAVGAAPAGPWPAPSAGVPDLPDGPQDTAGLEIGSSGVSPVIEEAAILYANDQAAAAAAVLVQAVREDQLGAAAVQAWLMLLDLYQFLGRQDAFESLAIDYAARFERSPPTWRAGDVAAAEPERAAAGTPAGIVLPARLDAGLARVIEAVDRAVQRNRAIALDCRPVRAIDAQGAALLRTAIERIEHGGPPAAFVGLDQLAEAVRAAVQPGRRDDDASGWLLLLDLLRLLGRQSEFEDTSIDYCVTYEVSPPSWSPMPAHLRCDGHGEADAAGDAAPPPADPARACVRADAFVLAGIVQGAVELELAALRTHAERHTLVFIDCARLQRLDFAAAGQLLNLVTTLRAAGRAVEFGELNHMVAALLAVVGVRDLATLTVRRI